MTKPANPDDRAPQADANPALAPYEAPTVQSVKLTPEAAESLT